MQRIALSGAFVTFALMLGVTPEQAWSLEQQAKAAVVDVSAQSRTVRPRSRIRVYPRYPRRNFHTVYPLPYEVEYPGPRAVRHCVSRLVPEYRPSGTVIVPRMRCWWARL